MGDFGREEKKRLNTSFLIAKARVQHINKEMDTQAAATENGLADGVRVPFSYESLQQYVSGRRAKTPMLTQPQKKPPVMRHSASLS